MHRITTAVRSTFELTGVFLCEIEEVSMTMFTRFLTAAAVIGGVAAPGRCSVPVPRARARAAAGARPAGLRLLSATAGLSAAGLRPAGLWLQSAGRPRPDHRPAARQPLQCERPHGGPAVRERGHGAGVRPVSAPERYGSPTATPTATTGTISGYQQGYAADTCA